MISSNGFPLPSADVRLDELVVDGNVGARQSRERLRGLVRAGAERE